MSESVKHDCGSCGEPVSIDAVRCPSCDSAQLTSRTLILIFAVVGSVLLPFSVWFFSRLLADGFPSGPAVVLYGVGIGLGLFGPLLAGAAVAGLIQRRRVLGRAE